MTGNVILLGFSLAGVEDFSLPASLTALAALAVFAIGAAIGALLALHANPALVLVLALVLLSAGGVIAYRGLRVGPAAQD